MVFDRLQGEAKVHKAHYSLWVEERDRSGRLDRDTGSGGRLMVGSSG